jgi:hypothetical protein
MSAALKISDELAAQATPQNLGETASAIYALINKCTDPLRFDEQGRLMWRAHFEGSVSEAEASFLSICLVNRRPLGRATAPGHVVPLGKLGGRLYSRFAPRQRQRSPDRKASRDRRRRLGGSSALPDNLRHHYTEGQRAVLCIVAGEVKHHGICDLPIDKIAAKAGVGRTTVQTTLHEARRLTHIKITERPRRGRKSLTNLVQILATDWLAWIRRGPSAHRPIGSNSLKMASTTKSIELIDSGDGETERGKENGCPSEEAVTIAADLARIAGHEASSLPRSWRTAKPEQIVDGWLKEIRRVVPGDARWLLRNVATSVMRRKPDPQPPNSIRYFGREVDKLVKAVGRPLPRNGGARCPAAAPVRQ